MKVLEYLASVDVHSLNPWTVYPKSTVDQWIEDMMEGDVQSLIKVWLTGYVTSPNVKELDTVNSARHSMQFTHQVFRDKEYDNEGESTIQYLCKERPESTRTEIPEGTIQVQFGDPWKHTSLPEGRSTLHREDGQTDEGVPKFRGEFGDIDHQAGQSTLH